MTQHGVSLPDKVSVQLNVKSLSVPLSAQLLNCGAGGAKHQLQVGLRGGGGLRAGSRRLRVHGCAIETHTAPLGVPLQPVPFSWPKSGLSCHTATTPIPLHVALMTQREAFQQRQTRARLTAERGGGGSTCTQHIVCGGSCICAQLE